MSLRTPGELAPELSRDEFALYDLDLEANHRLPDGRRQKDADAR